MTERPIIFCGPMVRAILDGRKTQTRRVVKPQPELADSIVKFASTGGVVTHWRSIRNGNPEDTQHIYRCPYGQPGDQLWVRETWCVGSPFDHLSPGDIWSGNEDEGLALDFQANEKRVWSKDGQGKWRPSIHMPRWASRITLEITGVRVERVQKISPHDTLAEGIHTPLGMPNAAQLVSYYRQLWDEINAKRGYGWDANPWIWVIEFRRV